jgi:biopolymer transport protein ExbD
MRILLITLLMASNVFASESHSNSADAKNESKHSAKKSASAEAYLKAKKECLLENKELKGKELKDCIVKKQTTEAK